MIDEYKKVIAEKENISKEIIEFIKPRIKNLYNITAKEIDLDGKLFYDIGEFETDKLRDEQPRTYQDMLYDLTDGVIFGYNLDTEGQKEWLEDINKI